VGGRKRCFGVDVVQGSGGVCVCARLRRRETGCTVHCSYVEEWVHNMLVDHAVNTKKRQNSRDVQCS